MCGCSYLISAVIINCVRFFSPSLENSRPENQKTFPLDDGPHRSCHMSCRLRSSTTDLSSQKPESPAIPRKSLPTIYNKRYAWRHTSTHLCSDAEPFSKMYDSDLEALSCFILPLIHSRSETKVQVVVWSIGYNSISVVSLTQLMNTVC